jgi:hypothetical protein
VALVAPFCALSVPLPFALRKTPVPRSTVHVVSMSAGFPNDTCAPAVKNDWPGKHTVPTSSSVKVLPSDTSVITRTASRSAQFVPSIGAEDVRSKALVAAP